MSLNGVDISGYDAGIDTRALTADFVIVKATEGLQGTIYNPGYRKMADDAAAAGKLIGFYHYANGNEPELEAASFYNAIKDYQGRAIACLDWEGKGNRKFLTGQDPSWCKRFLDAISKFFGGIPMLYTSKDVCRAYDWSSCRKYPLWGAQYAYENKVYQGYETDPWQSAKPWGVWGAVPTIHQYGYVNPRPNNGGISSGLDADKFYGTREDWLRMCGSVQPTIIITNVEKAARVVEHFIDHPAHGYSQIHRDGNGEVETLGFEDGTSVQFQGGDRDCSRLIQTAYVVVGILPRGIHMWTGNEIQVLKDAGFVQVPLNAVQRGDVLWRQGHTEMYLGDGMQGGALRSENHSIDGREGDQDGLEIRRCKYNPSEWTSAWRYPEPTPKPAPMPEPSKTDAQTEDEMIALINLDDGPAMSYFDGSRLRTLANQSEEKAIREVYKKTHGGKEIPTFKLGTKKEKLGSNLAALLKR